MKIDSASGIFSQKDFTFLVLSFEWEDLFLSREIKGRDYLGEVLSL